MDGSEDLHSNAPPISSLLSHGPSPSLTPSSSRRFCSFRDISTASARFFSAASSSIMYSFEYRSPSLTLICAIFPRTLFRLDAFPSNPPRISIHLRQSARTVSSTSIALWCWFCFSKKAANWSLIPRISSLKGSIPSSSATASACR